MKAYICDQCGKKEEANYHPNLPPKFWFDVNRYGPVGFSKQFCSVRCSRQFFAVFEEKENADKEIANANVGNS